MHIKFQVDVTIPRWLKLLAPVALVLAVAGITALVKAEQVAPASFADGDTLTAANLNSLRDAIRALANPDCPIGYDKDSTVTTYTVCKKGTDEVVKVGTGASAFWIDRYEASIWQNADGSGTQYGLADLDFPGTFPRNGQADRAKLLYALSMKNVVPSRFLTWFQATRACHATGKRLASTTEWFEASAGTSDPGTSDGSNGTCKTSGSNPRATGSASACVSTWGAQDMIGNLLEWTGEWYAGVGTTDPGGTWPETQAGGAYASDATWNIASGAGVRDVGWTSGVPAAGLRGGSWVNGTMAGIHSFDLSRAPSDSDLIIGFRCVVPNR